MWVREFVHRSLMAPAVEMKADPGESSVRRRIICGVTIVVGAAALRWSLGLQPGAALFYPATALLAAVWLVGARLSGPVAPGHTQRRDGDPAVRGALESLVWGTVLLLLFLAGALVVSRISMLASPVQDLLDHARRGSLPLVTLLTAINGVGEEYFFRGAMFQALPKRGRIIVSTVVYAAVTSLSGIPLLVLAALMLGLLTGMQRRATGGFVAPLTTHLIWSLGMLFLLPGALDLGARILG